MVKQTSIEHVRKVVAGFKACIGAGDTKPGKTNGLVGEGSWRWGDIIPIQSPKELM